MYSWLQSRYRLDLIWYRAVCSLEAEAARSYLGFLWWFIDPLLYLTVFYVVFAVVLNRGGDDFVAFLLAGLVIWKWFEASVKGGANSLTVNMGLIRQVYLKKIIFPVSAVIATSIKSLLVLAIFVLFLLLFGYEISNAWLYLPLLMVVQLCLILGVAIFLSAITPFFPDLTYFVNYGLTLMFFMSGIFFDVSGVDQQAAQFLALNPMLLLIDGYRSVLLEGNLPALIIFIYPLALGVVLWFCGVICLRRYDRLYARIALV